MASPRAPQAPPQACNLQVWTVLPKASECQVTASLWKVFIVSRDGFTLPLMGAKETSVILFVNDTQLPAGGWITCH